ncbi:MAG: hypothetical protein K5659_02750 [Lachnospiraceae bacterium]|nr:hypothetical protein [Lachnospiraceae bacterium]
MFEKIHKNVDTTGFEEKLYTLPFLYTDVLCMYYGLLDEEVELSLEEIAEELDATYGLKISSLAVIEHMVEQGLEMINYHGDAEIADADRVIVIDLPREDKIKSALAMRDEYECKAVYAVSIDCEDKDNPKRGVLDVTLMALNEQGLRKIDEIMGTGYKNKDDIYVRDFRNIVENKDDSYLVGIKVNWKFFLNRTHIFNVDELKYEVEVLDYFEGADMAILPPLGEIYYATSHESLIFDDDSLGYTLDDYINAENAAAVAAIYLEKRDILPIAGLDTLLLTKSRVLDYIYLDEEGAMYAAALDPAYIAGKAEEINIYK